MNYEKHFRYDGDKNLSLKDFPTKMKFESQSKATGEKAVQQDITTLCDLQDKLYAQREKAILLVFQAMDGAGKDSTIKHVMSGLNPQGCQVVSFKTPTEIELSHDYLWRVHQCVPSKGYMGVFNRSYYEEVLVTKVHPELLLKQRLPGIHTVKDVSKNFWRDRYKDIVHFENYLERNGTIIIKFFLHLSEEEQNVRFLDRIQQEDKRWKFSENDMKERAYWKEYQMAYQDALQKTATKENPWYIIPADSKWFLHLAVSKIIVQRMKKLKLDYPEVTPEQMEAIDHAKSMMGLVEHDSNCDM